MNFLYIVLFFIFIFFSGFWVSRLGKPYHTLIFIIHKLFGVGLGIFLIINVARIQKTAPLSPLGITLLVVTILIFVIVVAAGGLLSIEAEGGVGKVSQTVLNMISLGHKVFPYLAVLSTAALPYLLLFQKA